MGVKRIAVLAAAVALAAAAGVAGALYVTHEDVRQAARTATAPDVGGPFSLIDHTGRPVTDADYRGKLKVVYFGYTFCPDVCPTELSKIGQALDALGEDADRVQPLFITLDPERDTVAVMADYVSNFHPSFVGLTGSPEQIAGAAKAYLVYYAKAYLEGSDEGGDDYLVDHSAFIYVMGPDGRFLDALPNGTTVEEMTARIRAHLERMSRGEGVS